MKVATVRRERKTAESRMHVTLLVQPDAGTQPLLKGIASAKSSIEIVIFRFDQREIEQALAHAVSRGVAVHALIAARNRAGEENLRALELRLLGAGVTVARTGDDLVRYHGKYMIVDRRELYLLAFNLTHADMEHSRSFGVITRNRDVVREAVRLFETDVKRVSFESSHDAVVVSPVNARKELARFIQAARKELVIYDPQVSDKAMVRLLAERAKAGVRIRIIGRLQGKASGATAYKLAGLRLHTRTMVRDGQMVFIGSQSLREMELDARREVGLIFRDAKVAETITQVFEADWAAAEKYAREKAESDDPSVRIAKKVAKVVAREIPAVTPIVAKVVQEVVGETTQVEIVPEEMESMVKDAVKEAVKEAVRTAADDAVLKAVGENG